MTDEQLEAVYSVTAAQMRKIGQEAKRRNLEQARKNWIESHE